MSARSFGRELRLFGIWLGWLAGCVAALLLLAAVLAVAP